MLDVTKILIERFQGLLADYYRAEFGDEDPRHLQTILESCRDALGSIARCNASYHNVEHTIYVTTAGQAVLAGKRKETEIDSTLWLNITIALLYHDVGFVPDLCEQDGNGKYCTGKGDETVSFERGKTNASLMPYHVDRGQRYIQEAYASNDSLDIGLINRCIERTRFPIPKDPDYQVTDDYPGLVRAADLIGQFSDPRYLHKLNALFQEFDEQGLNEKIGYRTLDDMLENYPDFYENMVHPYIADGLRLLQLTKEGRAINESLEANLETARKAAARTS